MVRIDHVVYVVADLDMAARRMERDHGLGSVPGGHHPAWGTANRIVPLGSSYVELMAVEDGTAAAATAFGRFMLDAVARGDRLLAWCVAADDLKERAKRLDLAVDEGSRIRPDGRTLRWRSTGLETAVRASSLPFFIEWAVPDDLHPAREAVTHRAVPTGITWVQVGGREPRLAEWLGPSHGLPVRIDEEASSRLLAVGIATAEGEFVLS